MKKILVLSLIAVTIIFVFLYLRGLFSFPVTYKICGAGYVDCREIAKFKDRDSCEITREHWGWYCDQTDKSKIICVEKESDFTTGICD